MSICPICGGTDFVDHYNKNRNRLCTKCMSLERTRTFAELYDTAFYKDYTNNGRNLHISPSKPETIFFAKKGLKVETLDIRAELKTDIIADICHMPEIDSCSYDTIFASCVLQHVYDDEAALKEFKRILKDGGVVFLYVAESGKEETIFIDKDEISKWYGEEEFKRSKAGFYRKYGYVDFLKKLKGIFSTAECFLKIDVVTGIGQRWYRCYK